LTLELVVGPERLALYAEGRDAKPRMPGPDDKASLFCAGHPELPLVRAADHFEVDNPYGIAAALALAAVWQSGASARAARFQFSPENASTFHDHRPYHGGVVGMVGERHLELATPLVGKSDVELQLYVTDAYRQPLPMEGLHAQASLGDEKPFQLTPSGGCFVGRATRTKGAMDVHTQVTVPGEASPIAMDFYVEEPTAGPTRSKGPIEIRVGAAGFSPARLEVPAGAPVHLRFLRTSDDTCAKQVVFPALGLTRDLPLHKPVDVDVVVPRGELLFTCGMHMTKGTVVGL
jgi:hypothetical protein